MHTNSRLSVDDDVNYDLIIIGAGAAGLSLLLALDEVNYAGRILILETNHKFENDRIWSFWQTSDVPDSINEIVEHRWSSWSLSDQKETVVHRDESIPYCCLSAASLHQQAKKIASKRTNVVFAFGQQVTNLKTSNFQNFIQCQDNTFSSNFVVDTRPPIAIKQMFTASKNPDKSSGETSIDKPKYGLLQCFYGLEIKAESAAFATLQNKVKLMHDLTSTQYGLEFVYILPFSETSALIEFTGFYTELPDKAYLFHRAQEYVKTVIADASYTIIRKEQACLPMYNISYRADSKSIIKGGIAGGAMRASTGYSFLSIQRWARKTALVLNEGKRLIKFESIPRIYRLMDRVFLRVLIDNTSQNPDIFMRFSKSVSAATFARFMSEKATLHDICSVVLAMPKWIFIKAAVQTMIEGKP